jgi:hypothetical protein
MRRLSLIVGRGLGSGFGGLGGGLLGGLLSGLLGLQALAFLAFEGL